MSSKRNSSIDIFRLAAAALVIIQHYGVFPRGSSAALWADIFCRAAVPFFFILSGYFSWRDQPGARENYLKKQALEVLKIFLVSAALIMLFNRWAGFSMNLKPKNFLYLIFFNEPGFLFDQSHMWYLLALIYVLVIALAVEKAGLNKAAYICVPLLFAVSLILEHELYRLGVRRPCYTRNFLLDGLPFFYLGQMLRRWSGKFLGFMTKKRSAAALAFSAIGMALEGAALVRFNMSTDRTLFLFTVPLIVSVFALLLHFPGLLKDSFAARYARDASMVIYVVHHMVEEVIKIIAADVFGITMRDHVAARYFLILIFAGLIGFGYAVIHARLRSHVNG